jgi:drug/metabolite transporter (DMT)-like permease
MRATIKNSRAGIPANAGICCMLLGVLALSLSDASVKSLDGRYAALQILFLRAAVALPLIAALTLALGGRRALRTPQPGLHAWRGLLNVAGAGTFYAGLAHLQLAEATAIAYAAPIFVVLLSALVLSEKLDAYRLMAVVLGFGGVLIVVRPGSSVFQLASLYPLAAALSYAVMMVSARSIDPNHSFPTLMFYSVLPPFLFSLIPLPWVWQAVALGDWPVLLAIGVLSSMGISLISQGFRLAPASVVAPFDYSGLLWATLLGWVMWDELPDPVSYVGMGLIVVAGLVGVLRKKG